MLECTTNELCQIFGVTRPTISKYVRDGMPKLGRGRFSIPACHQWLVDRVKGDAPDTEDARRRLYVAQERHKSLETDILSGSMIPADDAHHFCLKVVSLCVTQFEALPARLGSSVLGLTRPPDAEAIIEEECIAARRALTAEFQQFSAKLEGV